MNHITWLAILIMVVALMTLLRNWFAARQTDAWTKAGAEVGLTYFGRDNDLLAQFSNRHLFQQAKKCRAECIEGIRGEVDGREIIVVDLCVPPSSMNRRNRYWKAVTVCIVSAPEMELPYCLLRPQVPVVDSLGKLFGGQDIDFVEDEGFSKAFVLQGTSELSIRSLFNAHLRSWFTDHEDQRLYFEGSEHVFLLHTCKMIPPSNIGTLIEDALGIQRLVSPSESEALNQPNCSHDDQHDAEQRQPEPTYG
jgi:hypothetical protein